MLCVAQLHARLRRERRERRDKDRRSAPATEAYGKWLGLVAASAASLVAAALVLGFARERALYAVVAPLVVFSVSQQALFASWTAFLFKCPSGSLVNFYADCAYVAVAGPLLALSWALTASTATATSALAALLAAATALGPCVAGVSIPRAWQEENTEGLGAGTRRNGRLTSVLHLLDAAAGVPGARAGL